MTLKIVPWNGEPIDVPGAYSAVPMSAYHGKLTTGDSASRSSLWTAFDKSPAHMVLNHYLNEDRVEDDESEALVLGRGAHHMLLGEADFSEHFVFHPETYPDGAIYPAMIGAPKPWTMSAKWCKAWVAAEQDEKHRTVLKPRHLEAVRGMAGGLYANPLVRAGILNGHIETTLVARDFRTGIWIKIRPDAVPTDSGDVADFKTIADISDEGIEKAIGDNGLFLQGAMARRVMTMLGLEFSSFSLVFAEKVAPFCARVKTLTDGDLDLGDRVLDASLELYARCLARNVWPGPGGEQTDAEYAQMAPWKRGRIERHVELLEKDSRL